MRVSALAPTLFSLMLAALFFFSNGHAAHAEATTPRVRKTKTTYETTTSDAEGDSEEDVDDALATGSSREPREKEITAKFGSKGMSGMSGCKTEEASKDAILGLKDDCKAWIKDQKGDLKGKYLTSSCEESCEDCGMSLKRCSVHGKVRYTVKLAK